MHLKRKNEFLALRDPRKNRMVVYDIRKAKEITALRKPNYMISLDGIKNQFKHVKINKSHALRPDIDLMDPAIAVRYEGGVTVIDGWHRLFRCSLLKRNKYPCYLLTDYEVESITVNKWGLDGLLPKSNES